MQFHIPQYIELEDKLFGPLTLKQAIYVAGGAGGVYLIYKVVPYIAVALPLMLGVGVFAWALAFYPKEKLGKPFIEILEAAFHYMMKDKLYTWKKTTKEAKLGKEEEFIGSSSVFTPVVPSGKLSDASFNLDVKGPRSGEEEEDFKHTKDLNL